MRPSTAAIRGCLALPQLTATTTRGDVARWGACPLNRPGSCGDSDPPPIPGRFALGELCFVDGDRRAYSHWASRSGGPQST